VVIEIGSTHYLLLLVHFGKNLCIPLIDRRKTQRGDMKEVIMAVVSLKGRWAELVATTTK
jgi:hypothetical protein